MLKLLQEIRGFAAIANRQPAPRSSGLVLAQVRSHVIQAALPRRKLSVKTNAEDRLSVPQPVKINHVQQAPSASVTLSAP